MRKKTEGFRGNMCPGYSQIFSSVILACPESFFAYGIRKAFGNDKRE